MISPHSSQKPTQNFRTKPAVQSKRVLIMAPYPFGEAASQRFRFEHYLTRAGEEGYRFEFHSFLSETAWAVLYRKGNTWRKLAGTIMGFANRIMLLFRLHRFDFVFIHREAAPLGPPAFEYLIARVFRKKIIFDFDDAIWLPNTSGANRIASRLKWHHKTGTICRLAHRVSCGNAYLAEFARQFNPEVAVLPTVVDTESHHNRRKEHREKLSALGWTGSHSTLKYLEHIAPVIRELEEELEFQFIVIADKKPALNLRSLVYIPWNKAGEIEDLLKMDIGLMPLPDEPWARGKCGFKAIQYMALGIPALVSPVGVNKDIVDDGINGFWCATTQEWKSRIRLLLSDVALRREMGESARRKTRQHYSVEATFGDFLKLFE